MSDPRSLRRGSDDLSYFYWRKRRKERTAGDIEPHGGRVLRVVKVGYNIS